VVILPSNKFGQTIRKILIDSLNKLDDSTYIKLYNYWLRGRNPGVLRNPLKLCDKINWLKINYRIPLLHTVVDKYAVREYVKNKIGKQYLNQLYFASESFSRPLYEKLPSQYVLKGTHGSGINLICYQKGQYSYDYIKKTTDEWLDTDYYITRREWAYKDVPRKLICEKLLLHSNGKIPEDLKVFCFNGVPQYIQVDFDRFGYHTRSIYDPQWKLLPFTNANSLNKVYPNKDPISKPGNLKEVIDIARELSKEFVLARIDLYNVDYKKIVFGEITLYPCSGTGDLKPVSYEYHYGCLLDLNAVK